VGSPCLEVWQMLDIWLDTCTCRWNMKCILWFWITCNLQEYAMLCFKSMHQILVNIQLQCIFKTTNCVTFMLIMKTCTCTMYMHKMYMYNVYVLTGNSFCRKWMKSTPCLWMKSIVHGVWNQQDTFLYMSYNWWSKLNQPFVCLNVNYIFMYMYKLHWLNVHVFNIDNEHVHVHCLGVQWTRQFRVSKEINVGCFFKTKV